MTKFLLDRMLGQTTKWLRLIGVNAKYAPEGEDEKLLRIAKSENRILITRDKELAREDDVYLVEKEPAEKIVKKILEEFDLKIEPLSRCSECNNKVKEVEKEKVDGEVPDHVFENKEKFWYCNECDKFYWRGSHWEKIMETIEDIVGSSYETT